MAKTIQASRNAMQTRNGKTLFASDPVTMSASSSVVFHPPEGDTEPELN
jgi:hypothetical protein